MLVFLAGALRVIYTVLYHVIESFITFQYLKPSQVIDGLVCFGVGFEEDSMRAKW